MQILLVRHGIAVELDAGARESKEDDLRQLTKGGRRKMRRIAKGLRRIVPGVSVISTSPLLRAVETGQILGDRYEGVPVVQIAPLSPRKSYNGLLEWLSAQKADATVAL